MVSLGFAQSAELDRSGRRLCGPITLDHQGHSWLLGAAACVYSLGLKFGCTGSAGAPGVPVRVRD